MMVEPQKTGDALHDLKIDLEAEHFSHLGTFGLSAARPVMDRIFDLSLKLDCFDAKPMRHWYAELANIAKANI